MRLLAIISLFLLSLSACAEDASQANSNSAQPAQSTTAAAQAPSLERYRAGVHYLELPRPVKVDDPTKVEVVEVFWYGCGHCFHFEPTLVEWKKTKPADVNLILLPAMWNRAMEMHARAFFAAENMGVLDKTHQAMFDALNLQNKRLTTPEEIAEVFAAQGIDKEEAVKQLTSFGVTSQLKKANARTRSYQISGTPQIVVHGRYLVQANADIKQKDMLNVVNFLANKVRQEGLEK